VKRGRFIALEGVEACGKTTQCELLATSLGALHTREPGGTPVGERVRELILDVSAPAVTARAETLLLLAARAHHVQSLIEPALATGRDVVCDRFSGSTLAYQGFGRGLPLDELRRLCSWASAGLEPDLVLLLRVSPSVAAARLSDRGLPDRMEGEGGEFFRRVAAGYDALAAADPSSWRVLDADGTVEVVVGLIDQAVRAFFD